MWDTTQKIYHLLPGFQYFYWLILNEFLNLYCQKILLLFFHKSTNQIKPQFGFTYSITSNLLYLSIIYNLNSLNNLLKDQMSSLQVQSVVSQTAMLWKAKPKQTNPIIQKIIVLDKTGHAIILKNDCNKPLRFLYLCLLMSKKNAYNISTLISKMNQIQQKSDELVFLGIDHKMQAAIGNDTTSMYKNLLQLHRKMQLNKFSQVWILKTVIEYEHVDYLLILILRAIADEYKMVNALDCECTLTLGQVQILLNKFFVDKGAITNQRNKYVIFWSFEEYEIAFFKERGVMVQSEAENYQEISDPAPIKYEDCLMIEKVYSLLDERKK